MPAIDGPQFDFFFYGTLRDADLRRIVIGRTVPGEEAELADHEAVPAAAGRFPLLQSRRGHKAAGVLCTGLGLGEAARLSLYESEGRDYAARPLSVHGAAGSRVAWVYLPLPSLRRGGGRWDLGEWERFAKADATRRAARAMRGLAPSALESAAALWRDRAGAAGMRRRAGYIS